MPLPFYLKVLDPAMHQDFLPTASLQRLKQRAELLKRIRRFFDQRGFFEVETPILSHDTCVDRHLHPIAVDRANVLGRAKTREDDSLPLWLQTSPEFGMKRLLAAGAEAIYQISKVFRGGESGSRHNPEFTMLEWYRVGDNQQSGMDLLAEFTAQIVGSNKVDQISYANLFQQFLAIDPHRASLDDLRAICQHHQIHLEEDSKSSDDRDFWLNLLLSQVIEPALGFDQPAIIFDWPESQSALATVRPDDPPVAERFELFINGLEIANGYHELLDANELRTRNQTQNQLRLADGADRLPEKSRLLDAMAAGIPPCSGVALGVDRLAMLLLDASRIEDVLAFPFDRA
jgi:elongation factor P--(R)-beta-lysine ligase